MNLKPCPFCGGAAILALSEIKKAITTETNIYKCGCPVCNIFFCRESTYTLTDVFQGTATFSRVQDGMSECAELWNRRVYEGQGKEESG